jgi:type II restriction enzyme
MDLCNFKFITEDAIIRRRYWIDEIVKLSGHFVNDSSRVENEIIDEVKKSGSQALLDHLRLCTAIPESYDHDSSEEKLYSKYTDALISECFKYLGLNSIVLTERADAADVEVVCDSYSFVADAKVFRLSRTAKNQKTLKFRLWMVGEIPKTLQWLYVQYISCQQNQVKYISKLYCEMFVFLHIHTGRSHKIFSYSNN